MRMGAICVCLAVVSAFPAAHADVLRYQAVWNSGTGSSFVTEPLDRAAFIARGEQLTAERGLILKSVETVVLEGRRLYIGLWVGGSGPNIFDGAMGPIEFHRAMDTRRANGLMLVDVATYPLNNGGRRYVGVWRPGTGDQLLTGPMSEAAFLARGQRLAEGQPPMRLIDVEVDRENGQLVYTGLWRSGSGANFLTTPLTPRAFREERDRKVAEGLELRKVERVLVDGGVRYVGIWASGSGESRISAPRDLDRFVVLGERQAAEGMLADDIEVFAVTKPPLPPHPIPPNEPHGVPPGVHGDAWLPDAPPWIHLTSHQGQVRVDFGTIIEGKPLITLDREFLPDYLPVDANGNKVIPNNFCGLRMYLPSEVIWFSGGGIDTNFPYNHIESFHTDQLDHEAHAGLDFTGPIGACAGTNEPWQFFQPITQNGLGGPPPAVELDVEMPTGSVDFLNFNVVPSDFLHHDHGEALDALDLFSEEVFDRIKEYIKWLGNGTSNEAIESAGFYCNIRDYVDEVCEETPTKCPINRVDFVAPC